MNKSILDKLKDNIQFLTNARKTRNFKGIAKSYERIAATITKMYQSNDVTTALEVEQTLIASEQNGINKMTGANRETAEHLSRIARAKEADQEQKGDPKKYHHAALLDHLKKHLKDGTAYDTIRGALDECRKDVKNQLIAPGAYENEAKMQCNIIRYNGLAGAERSYVERQVEHQAKYASPEIKEAQRKTSLAAYDGRMRAEQRDLTMTTGLEQKPQRSR